MSSRAVAARISFLEEDPTCGVSSSSQWRWWPRQPASLAQAPAPGPGRGGGQPVQPIQMVKPGLYVVPGGGLQLDRPGYARGRDPRGHEDAGRRELRWSPGADPLGDAVAGESRDRDAPSRGSHGQQRSLHRRGSGSDRPCPPRLEPRHLPVRPAARQAHRDVRQRARRARWAASEARVLHLGRAHTGGDSVGVLPGRQGGGDERRGDDGNGRGRWWTMPAGAAPSAGRRCSTPC